MAIEYSTPLEIGSLAHPFQLPGTDGKTYSLDHFSHVKGLLVVFMCNHCPYVIGIQERLNQIAKDYASRGIAVIGINSNDPLYREEDSFENMVRIAKEWNLVFPYLFDETQSVARAYDAACTPDPYLYQKVDGNLILHYHGRIDDSWQDESKVSEKSLRRAMDLLLAGQKYDLEQIPSMGCSIKWKELTAQKLAEKAAIRKAQEEGKK
jgi:peroxiredoxin